jgi:hypothetical protein
MIGIIQNSFWAGVDEMRKKTMVAGVIVAGCVAAAVGFMTVNNIRFMPMKIISDARIGLGTDAERQRLLNAIYDTNFLFDRVSIHTAKIMIPKYAMTTEETAARYADLFGFAGDAGEFEDYWLYEKDGEKLYIDRYSAYLWYENPVAATGDEPAEAAAVTEKAAQFVQEKFPALVYEKIAVQREEGNYLVQFIDELNGYSNYAFPLLLIYNGGGVLTAIDYYFLEYETIAAVNLKPMKQAFNELPVDFDGGGETKIDLKSCTVVYIYEESILQPAYLFEGAFASGDPFRYFVRAAVYQSDGE